MTAKKREAESWSLVCITEKGKVSILKDLSLRVARETYRRLLPRQHLTEYNYAECSDDCQNGRRDGVWMGGCSYTTSHGRDDDRLERVEAIGPPGRELHPWRGIKPHVVNYPYCRHGKIPKLKKPEPPKWDESRPDFWNKPDLWDGIDPAKQPCWDRSKTWKSLIRSSGPQRSTSLLASLTY